MQFERTDEYEQKLFEQALCNENHVIKDATIRIVEAQHKLKAFCLESRTYLQFPRHLRVFGKEFTADVVEVPRDDVRKYYRAVKGSIRESRSNEVIA